MSEAAVPIYFAHANGLPGEVYSKFFEAIAPHPVSFIPMLGHGNFQVKDNWEPLLQELIEDIRRKHTEPVIGIGHSLGGILILWAARRHPELFQQVILLDPPLFTGSRKWAIALVRILGLSDRYIPPVAKTKRRRRTFASIVAAEAYWKTKAFFQAFDPECFADYVEHGLVPDGKGGVTLRFRVEVEYQIFLHSPLWPGKMHLDVPSTFIYAESHDVLRPSDVAHLKRLMPGTRFEVFPASHTFPLEKPIKAASAVLRLIERL